jgi:hypothetical protein
VSRNGGRLRIEEQRRKCDVPVRISLVAPITSLFVVLAAAASAQPPSPSDREPLRLSGGVDWISLWDDETFLGRGPLLHGGVSVSLGASTWLEAELYGGGHRRDAGYLVAEGTPIGATGRVAYRFGEPGAAARPYISGGFTALHSTAGLTTRSIVVNDRGFPMEGPSTRREWSSTKAAFELGAGLSLRTAGRAAVRPELRWTMTRTGGRDAAPLELPLMMIRAGLAVEWSSK